MGRRLKKRFGCAIFALFISTALAQPFPSAPKIQIEGEGLDARAFEKLLKLELASNSSRLTELNLTVRGRTVELWLRLDDRLSRTVVSLAPIEPERALALYVAEWVRAGAPRAPALPTADVEASTPQSAWNLTSSLKTGSRVFANRGAVLFSSNLDLGARHAEGWRLTANARYAYSQSTDRLGIVRAHWAALGPSAAFTFFSRQTVALAGILRLEVGALFGHGSGENAASDTVPTLGGATAFEIQFKLGKLTPVAELELGLIRGAGFRSDARMALWLSGFTIGAHVGLLF